MSTQQLSIADGLALLRVPFKPNQISYLPKGGVKLAYVGHAALTDRLLDADPAWTWEPFSVDERGLPALDGFGGMWIRLTVCGQMRIGYGHAGGKETGDGIKEVIGDALRNAAMRFGAALDLWHKGDLHGDDPSALEKTLEASIAVEKNKRGGVMGAVLETVHLEPTVRNALTKLHVAVQREFVNGPRAAFDLIEEQGLNGEEKLYLWSLLPSNIRSALKVEAKAREEVQLP